MSDEQPTVQPLSASQREALEEAVGSYEQNYGEARAILRHRGVQDGSAAGFRLGVVVDPYPGHNRYAGMLAIPYLDKDDKPVSIRFRCLKEHDHREHGHGKFNTMPGEASRVYNIGAIHRAADTIHVTEGEPDCWILNQEGYPAVAIPGAQGWKSHHRRMLAGFSRIFVWGDGDDAGADFGRKVTNAMRSAKAIRVPLGEDVNSIFLKSGKAGLDQLVRGERLSKAEQRAKAIASAPDF